MSDNQGSSSSAADRERKGKGIKLSDDEQKETEDKKQDISAEDLSVYYTMLERGGEGSYDDFFKKQQQALPLAHQTNIHDQKSQTAGSSDDERKETVDKTEENRTWQQNPSPSLTVPSGISAEDLSIYHMAFEKDGGGSFNDFVKNQQQALQLMKQTNIPVQKTQTAELSDDDFDRDAQIRDCETYSTDSDANEEDVEILIFELEISDRNRLVIPYETAAEHFPPMIIYTNSEETLHLFDPHQKMWEMTLIYDSNVDSYIITTGFNAYLEHYHLKPPDLIRVYLPVPQLNINDFYIEHQKNFGESLFAVRIPNSNRLPIPYDVARDYFNPSDAPDPPNHLSEFTLHLTDSQNQTWELRFVCFKDEKAYIVVRGWEQYAAHHVLNHSDTIRFFRQNRILEKNKFMVCHELSGRVDSFMLESVESFLFLAEELVCELCLSEADVGFGRLEMPGVELPSYDWFDQEMVKLTDTNNKDWYVIIRYQSVSREFIILDGWEGIVREHRLEAGNMVRLYKPADAHDKHFLIEFVKKKKNAEKVEGGGGSGKPDDAAEQSRRKGKNIVSYG